ncbi:hypothetical protein B296_00038865 [Ensete ventricosum]|uniref:Uncharacterized protein n=1 Tax=Ensete ventricosum TaxID=4639 RepID=A0A426ZV68_ENSVE|nr:hypothetical protein B296_00038865 [Ensete ventricosum]
MEEESFMDMLRTGEEEDYLLSRYSSISPTGMLYSGEEEDAVSALRRDPHKANDSSPPPTTVNISKSPIKKVGERIMALQRLVSPFGKVMDCPRSPVTETSFTESSKSKFEI